MRCSRFRVSKGPFNALTGWTLPQKRDRSTVVDDSVEYVKNLHQRLKDTQKRRADILKAHAALSSEVLTVHTPKQNNRATCHNLSSPDLRKVAVNAAFIRTSPESKEIDSDAKKKASCIDNIQVHVDLPHQIVIEMTCRSHPHIQSQIMKELERLAMDISRCSMAKHQDRLVCVIIMKPRIVSKSPTTSDDITEALKRALVPEAS